MDHPLVCICVPCFNAAATISETLATIRNQSYPNIEIHIFDNASTDKTVECIENIDDERISLHLAESTDSAESNFTRCLNLGRGDYTAIFHADDLYDESIIEKEVQLLEKNIDTSGVLTFATLINDQGLTGKTHLAPASLNMQCGDAKVFDVVSLFKAVLESGNFLFCPSAMMRTSVCVAEINEWRGNQFKSSADLDVWLRFAAYNHIALINEPLLFYRISEGQHTAVYRKKRMVRDDLFLVLDYWLKKENIKLAMTRLDRDNYHKLQHYDTLGCILNAIRDDEIPLAKNLLANEKKISFVRELMQISSARNVKFFILSCLLKLMLLPVFGCPIRFMFLKCLEKVRL